MNVYQILCLLGVPSLIAALLGYLFGRLKKAKKDTNALKMGVQALLRSQMIKDWNKYFEAGYAPIYAKENFENCWQQYHSLGANGVMDDIHNKFLALPTEPP
ncbi:MAG: hypothetical protein NC215_07090 [Ruminococcus sp.]|nr:hypothetical protein [Ruminococcus sp.]MCM1393260.1 hypothetical protein [Ruminococcus sp.]